MIGYKVHYHDKIGGDSVIGIFPERRKDPKRITKDSVMEWVRETLSDRMDIHRISFVKVILD